MKISKELLKGTTAIMILRIISKQDSYGYQIIRELSVKSSQLFNLNEGTLYPILHTMEKEGIVESYRKESESGRERKYYKITAKGKIQLAAQMKEWEMFYGSVNGVLREED